MKKKYILATGIALLCVILAAITYALTTYPYAKICFSGFNMVTNGTETYGYVDVILKDVNATGVSFYMQYDTKYLALADPNSAPPNNIVKNKTAVAGSLSHAATYDTDHKYFIENTTDFPTGSFKEIQYTTIGGPNPNIIGNADPDNGLFNMNFVPKENSDQLSPFIHKITVKNISDLVFVADGYTDTQNSVTIPKQDLVFGKICFKILDPATFTKLSQTQLENILKIAPENSMTDSTPALATPIPGATAEPVRDGVNIQYINDDSYYDWYDEKYKNVKYEFNINLDLKDVQPQVSNLTVSSYDLYNSGTPQDLLDLINEKMSMMTLTYSDGSTVPAVFEWTMADSNINMVAPAVSWDPKGNATYTITQKYNDDFNVSVTVNVTPVNFMGFSIDHEYDSYYYDTSAANNGLPVNLDGLELPRKAKMLFDTYIPSYGVSEVKIDSYSLDTDPSNTPLTDLPSNFVAGVAGDYVFKAQLNAADADIATNYPWLTAVSLNDIKARRRIVTASNLMKKDLTVTQKSVDNNGVFTITVGYSDNTPISPGSIFHIRLPNNQELISNSGILMSLASNNNKYTETYNADGTVTITMSPDPTASISDERNLASIINMGSRAGTFEIACDDAIAELESSYADCTPDPRTNEYTVPANPYVFDYSGLNSAMFPVKAGTTLPTTITLPIPGDEVETTYSGYDGTVPGALKTVTVDSWTITGDTTTPGSIVTAVGRLSDTTYTNYGEVSNPNNVDITIKYYVTDNSSPDSIAAISDAVYDQQQVGYDHSKLQTKSFTITNTGADTLYGLSVQIEWSNDTPPLESFNLSKIPISVLDASKSTTFDITTLPGLPVGVHTSKVSILSNNNVLQTFNVTFEVTAEAIYNINITVVPDPSTNNLGNAKTQTNTYTSVSGQTVTIIATPEQDCRFVGWTSSEASFASNTAATTTFVMPNSDVNITATFEETLGAKLRATDLLVKDTNDMDQTLRDNQWQAVSFDPVKRTYYVTVPNLTDKVKLWFKPRPEAANATFTIENDHNSTITSIAAPTLDAGDNYYKSVDIDLDVCPIVNQITLKMSYDDPSDNPDEGLVERSYTINVYRKVAKSDLMKFNPGNSPFGLIERMAAPYIVSSTPWTAAQIQAAKDEFISPQNDFTFTSGFTPDDGDVGTHYYNFWGEIGTSNYDTDPTALFIRSEQPFSDPSYDSVQNSIGQPVNSADITRSLTVNVLTEPNASKQDGSSDDFVLVTPTPINLPNTIGSTSVLVNYRIRPDVYELVYTFTDYDNTTVEIKRPFIILSQIGDVNISGATDTYDTARINNRFLTDIANNDNLPGYTIGGALFKYRVCDINKDGQFNAVDANHIHAGLLTQFYRNLV